MISELKAFFEARRNVVHSVTGDTTIKDAVDKLNIHKIGALMVISETGEIEGIFSERDVMRKLASTDELVGHIPVKEIMTGKDMLITITGEEPLADVLELMIKKKIRHLPVIMDGTLKGIIAMGDVVSILLKYARQENEDLHGFITGKYPA